MSCLPAEVEVRGQWAGLEKHGQAPRGDSLDTVPRRGQGAVPSGFLGLTSIVHVKVLTQGSCLHPSRSCSEM